MPRLGLACVLGLGGGFLRRFGGFRLAFERAGCQCVFSCDWNQHAQKTYAANFGEAPAGDIHAVAVADILAHDILCGGFPCQPFSIAGTPVCVWAADGTNAIARTSSMCDT